MGLCKTIFLSLFLGFKEGEFNWASYLKNCKAQAAPKSLFKTLSTVSGDIEYKMFSNGSDAKQVLTRIFTCF